MKSLRKFTQALILVSLVSTINIPSAFASKTGELTRMQKAFEICLLDGGVSTIPADGKGATCCFPKNKTCITCVGAYCSADKKRSGRTQLEDKRPAAGSPGKVLVPKNKSPKKMVKQESLESKGVLAPRRK